VAKTLDQSIYINTDWEKCLEEMRKAGFVEAEAKEERLKGPALFWLLLAVLLVVAVLKDLKDVCVYYPLRRSDSESISIPRNN